MEKKQMVEMSGDDAYIEMLEGNVEMARIYREDCVSRLNALMDSDRDSPAIEDATANVERAVACVEHAFDVCRKAKIKRFVRGWYSADAQVGSYEDLGRELERRYFLKVDHDRIKFCHSVEEARNGGHYHYSGLEWKYYKRLGELAENVFVDGLDMWLSEDVGGK